MEGGSNNRLDLKGRGTSSNPPNRFDPIDMVWDPEWLESERLAGNPEPKVPTQLYRDQARTVLARNDSPDVTFDYSLNPYRGCEHGCVYCYARPSHEYLGFSAGLDFESKLMVKLDAPELLAKELRARRWRPQVVGLSGNTDCYQPIERKFQLTRRCLEVFLNFGNPVEVITKSALVLRDLDVLAELAKRDLVRVTVSVTTLDGELARRMEPRAAAPAKRLDAIAGLAQAGIPTNVNVAPLIPGLNDHEMPAILEQAAERGATAARYIMLRLPLGVEDLFVDWLEQAYPKRAKKVIHAIQEVRGGAMSDIRFGRRMKGQGVRADALARLFTLHCKKLGLSPHRPGLAVHHFKRDAGPQQSLF
ncbi:MAG: PA0069 family radical SAM protein [SAR324 cluster bacterium]|nr:PA0069 family radical SAM protein [SAR324 cluster bacterium]